MSEIREWAERLWSGESTRHAWRSLNVLERVADGTWFCSSFANMSVFETPDGLVLVDPGARNNAEQKYRMVREQFDAPLHTAIYTHGHHDHVWGVDRYLAEAEEHGWDPPRVVGHEALLDRFERYRKTSGWNAIINSRQFMGGAGVPEWPTDYVVPDTTYRDTLDLDVGGVRFALRHARGETDDATWIFVPERRVLVTGDLFVWVAPNAGNPQKVQRYAGEWAQALRTMIECDAELLLPGHGAPIFGRDRVRRALEDTARFLGSLESETLELMNRGLSLDEIVQQVEPPPELLARPYLRPVYDEPEFVVRNIWRLYGGWYDGEPAHLKPAPAPELAAEVAALAGTPEALAGRARALADEGEFRLACHLADWAWMTAPDDEAIRAIRGAIYARRAELEVSTMAIGIYRATAREMGIELDSGSTFVVQDRAREQSGNG
jgi:alkyl sulfatase BDS1-like metallo-beta-lactamase superfamily hydrolase